MKGLNRFKTTPDNHDFMAPDHIARFLRNHRTGIDNEGRKTLADIIARFHPNETVVDAACGTCVNWEVFKAKKVPCKYIGVDRTEGFLEHARGLYGSEIELKNGYVQELPFPDGGAEVVIMRHILEHLQEGYELAIREGMRVASKELIVVLFVDPHDGPDDQIKESEPDENGCTHFWNTYSWPKMTEFLSTLGCKIVTGRVVTFGAAAADTIIRIIK